MVVAELVVRKGALLRIMTRVNTGNIQPYETPLVLAGLGTVSNALQRGQ